MDDHARIVAITTHGIKITNYDQELSRCCLAQPLEE
jgi:hypothetical protein